MFCSQCGRQLPDEAMFCDVCGSRCSLEEGAEYAGWDHTLEAHSPGAGISPGKLILSGGIQILLPVQGKFLLGRRDDEGGIRTDYDLTPLDIQQYASRRHAEIEMQFGEYVLRDLNSRNGTYVNGRKLVPNEEVLLKDQDRLAFGLVAATFVR